MSGYSAPRLLRENDNTADFDCGEASLDEYLRRRALANSARGASRCYVTCREGQVVGYYALASGSVQHRDLAGRFRRNMPDPIPVIMITRLAVHRLEQRAGLGGGLLRDAIARSMQAADIVGVRALIVHALHDQAREFYLHFDFEPSPTDPLHLLLLMKDARAAIEL